MGYIVKEGDTLWSIAKAYFTTVESIREQNEDISDIKPGDKLLIVKRNKNILVNKDCIFFQNNTIIFCIQDVR